MVYALVITPVLVFGCVWIHLGVLLVLNAVGRRFKKPQHVLVGLLVLGAIVGHLFEIGLFAVGLYTIALVEPPDIPDESATRYGVHHALYHSAVAYTSLGGSPMPLAGLRLLTAVEALTGLILIAWTASFIFLFMQRYWER